jgi:hypothetical protein
MLSNLILMDLDEDTYLIIEPNYARIESPEPWQQLPYQPAIANYINPFMTDEPNFGEQA